MNGVFTAPVPGTLEGIVEAARRSYWAGGETARSSDDAGVASGLSRRRRDSWVCELAGQRRVRNV
jgi:hypothetical protein